MRNLITGRQISLFLLGLSLFALLGASQCSQVVDDATTQTGSLVGRGGDDDCLDDCEDFHKDWMRDESSLHKSNMNDCKRDDDDRRDSGEEEVACLQEEAQRHLDMQQQIASSHLDCIAECGGFDDFDDCVDFCESEGERQEKDAEKIHRRILKACRDHDDDDDDDDDSAQAGGTNGVLRSGGGDDDNPCTEAENARYEAALAQIEAWVAECAGRCHDQGGGSGGQ